MRNTCAKEQPEGYTMRNHCERQRVIAEFGKDTLLLAGETSMDRPLPMRVTFVDVDKKCTRDWPDDFVMRKYCRDQQYAAEAKLTTRPIVGADERTIRLKCERDWPDDYVMRNHCEEQQFKALRQLR
jgi:hypothetical protein